MAQPTQRRRIRRSSLDGLARGRLDHLKADLIALGYPNALFTDSAITFTNATNQVTLVEDLDTAEIAVVFFTADAAGALPAELEAGTLYYLVYSAVTEWDIYPSLEDAAAGTNAVTFTDDGSGTLTLYNLPG